MILFFQTQHDKVTIAKSEARFARGFKAEEGVVPVVNIGNCGCHQVRHVVLQVRYSVWSLD